MSKRSTISHLPTLLHKFYTEPFDLARARTVLLHPQLSSKEGRNVLKHIKINNQQSPNVYKFYLIGIARRGDKVELEKAIEFVNKLGIKSEIGGWRDVYLLLHAARNEIDPLITIFSSAIVENKLHLISRMDFLFCLQQLGEGKKNALQMFEVVWREMREAGVPADLFISNTFIQLYAKQGNNTQVKKWIESLRSEKLQPNGFTFHYVIAEAAKSGNFARVERWMNRMKIERVKPEFITFNTIVDVKAKSGDLAAAEHWMEEMRKSGLEATVVTYTSMISAAARKGDEKLVNKWLDEMRDKNLKPDLITFNILIDLAMKKGDRELAQQWLEKMKKEGLTPDAATFSSLMRGSKEDFSTWIDKMEKEGVQPSVWIFNTLIREAVQAGNMERVDHLLAVMQRKKVKADVVTFSNLVVNAAKEGKSETVQTWFNKLRTLGVPELQMRRVLADMSKKGEKKITV